MPNEDEIDDVLPAKNNRPDDQAFGETPRKPREPDLARARVRDDAFDDAPRVRSRREDDEGDATGGLIPYKNAKALMSYYCGVFSLIPCLGAILGPIAVVLGFLGFSYANKHPKAAGKAHAIVGIVLGSLVTLGHLAIVVLMLVGALSK